MARKLQVIGKSISGEIAAPETAEVGQVLAVKAVDQSGKPTEWEAVDLPEPVVPDESSKVGLPTKGEEFIVDGSTVVAKEGAEIFNDYENNIAIGYYSHAEGSKTAAKGSSSHAEGFMTEAGGEYSHSEGQETTANGDGSHSEGHNSSASAEFSHAEGDGTTAGGVASHAEGQETTTSGDATHAEGYHTTASCEYAHAEGMWTTASEEASHAEGCGTIAAGYAQHVQGKYNLEDADSVYAHIVGNGDSDIRSNAHTLDWSGNAWFQGKVKVGGTGQDDENAKELATIEYVDSKLDSDEGDGVGKSVTGTKVIIGGSTVVAKKGAEIFNDYNNNIATGQYSHAEGSGSRAFGDYSHAEGNDTTASGYYSHVEGLVSTASMDASHAEGYHTTASGYASHAEGYHTTAYGNHSHAEGYHTTAYAPASHAEGMGTYAYGRSQHVQGECNIVDPDYDETDPHQRGKYAHIVGNGSYEDSIRSNAHTLDWEGNAWFQGKVLVGGTGQDDENAKELLVAPSEANVGQVLVVKSVDTDRTPIEWEAINFPDPGESVINVLELPEDEWDESRLYRLQRFRFVINRDVKSTWPCHIVETLPEYGEPALIGSPADMNSIIITAYATPDDGSVYGYVDSNLSAAFGGPEGWFPLEDLMAVIGWNYAGIITDITEDPCDGAYRLLVEAQLYYRMNDYWYPVNPMTFRGTAEVGQTLAIKAVDEHGRPTEWKAVDFPESSGGGSGGGTGAAIIDVTELPTENINEDAFYRVLTGTMLYNQFVQTNRVCYCVEQLPDVGVPALSGDLSSIENANVAVYYNVSDENVYAYVPNELSAVFGVPAGWYPAAALMSAVGQTFNGVITNILDDPMDGTIRVLLEYVLYSYKEGWTSHKVLGRAGTGIAAEVFNHPANAAIGAASHAEGWMTTASGDYSHAEGAGTTAEGDASHAEGGYTRAEGWYSHAEGYETTTYGNHSHAEGYQTQTRGYVSHAEGSGSRAFGDYSHAEGEGAIAYGRGSHAEGYSVLRAVYISGPANATTYKVHNQDESSAIYTYNVGMYITGSEGLVRIMGVGADSTITLESTLDPFNSFGTDDTPKEVWLLGGATGIASHVEGTGCLASGDHSSARGYGTIASGKYATAEGCYTIASGPMSHAEGGIERCPPTTASGHYSHAEGVGSVASGATSHAQGFLTLSAGSQSHAEGYKTESLRSRTHAEGHRTFANGLCSHSEGRYTLAKGDYSHAEGVSSIGTPWYLQHTPGLLDVTVISESEYESRYCWSGTKGSMPTLNSLLWSKDGLSGETGLARVTNVNTDDNSFTVNQPLYLVNGYARLYSFGALGEGSHVEGMSTTAASAYQHVQGKCNVEDLDNRYAHIVGGGTGLTSPQNVGGAFSNIHTLDWQGNASWLGASGSTTGADYAEYFEWADGNPGDEDRVGLIVTLDGDKIRVATNADDDILGVISGTAAVIGDTAEWEWKNKYITDDFGRIVWDMVEEFVDEEEEFEVMVEETVEHVDEEGNVTTETVQVPKTETRTVTKSVGFFPHRRLNPNYDPNQEYVSRADRPEWDTVGMLGKLHVRDDGTCQINGYACVGENGVATASSTKTNMRVLARVSDNIVKILLK